MNLFKPTDAVLLAAIGESGTMTYVIKNRLQGAYPTVTSPWVLRQMKRLEAAGKVRRIPSAFRVMICWAPT